MHESEANSSANEYNDCIQSDNYLEPKLYISREEVSLLKRLLLAFINEKRPSRRILVSGKRGVGKSIGTRAALCDLESNPEISSKFFSLIIQAEILDNEKDLLTNIAFELISKIKEEFDDDDLLKELSHLYSILQCDSITRSELHRIAREIEANAGIRYGLFGFIKLILGGSITKMEDKSIEETSVISITNSFRISLLEAVLSRISEDEQILLFIDNLDQITCHIRVDKLLKYLFELKNVILVISIRDEYVPMDIRRENRFTLRFNSLNEGQLMEMLDRRLKENCPGSSKNMMIRSIGNSLTPYTQNPLAFLRWLEYLYFFTDLNIVESIKNLKDGYMKACYGIASEDIISVSKKYFKDYDGKYIPIDVWMKEFGMKRDSVLMLERLGVLVPIDACRAQSEKEYMMSSLLEFFRSDVTA